MLKRRKAKTQTRKSPSRQDDSSRSVFSYYSSRTPSEVSRPRSDVFDQKTKSVNRNVKYIPSFVALVLIVCSIGYTLFLDTNKPKIIPLTQSDNSLLRSGDFYQNKIADMLNKSIVNRTKLTIDTSSIENDILEAFPELEEVSVNIPLLGKRPIIQISSTNPSLVISSTDSYVVGINGKALMKLSDSPENIRPALISVNDKVAIDIEVGDTVLPISTLNFIDDIKYQFTNKKLEIDYIELPAIANELHVRPKGYTHIVRFNLQDDAREQVGRYFAVIDKVNSGDLPMPQAYVDVRTDGRVYYK